MEELVRAYFLRAGFFVMRGVPLRHAASDLTDIDLWIYERSAVFARRRTIIDIKDRKSPQAAERLFFVKGLSSIIAVEGAGVATTDNRPALRELARKHGLLWIDGADIQRLKESDALASLNRITEEELNSEIAAVDKAREGKVLREKIDHLKSAVADRFGPSCANTAIDGFQSFAREVVNAHPSSAAAKATARLAYLSAAIAAAAFDFASADCVLRPPAERVRHMIGAIRYGADSEGAFANLRWAETAIREYLPNGAGAAQIVRDKFLAEFEAIPAQGLAEIIVKLSNSDKLFTIAKALEKAAYSSALPSFDFLDADAKGFLGALLDFAGVNRMRFAGGWTGSAAAKNERDPQDGPAKPAAPDETEQISPPPADTSTPRLL